MRSCFALFLCVPHAKIVSDLNVKSVTRRTKINCVAQQLTRVPGTMKQSSTVERGGRGRRKEREVHRVQSVSKYVYYIDTISCLFILFAITRYYCIIQSSM